MPTALAAEEARLMERWLVNDALSERTVNHEPFAEVLKKYRVETRAGAVFDYAAVSEADIAQLDAYLVMLSRTDVDRLNRNEQMAFWINAYNALVIRIVLSEYPVSGINDIGGGLFSSGPWAEKRFRVYLIDLSLNDIYHRILRPIWGDNRVHYALSCAAMGCPDLPPKPFNAATLEENLQRAAENFVNGPKAVLQISAGGVRLSRIYDWYEEDFGGTEGAVLAHLKSFAGPRLGASLEGIGNISGHAFDWSLNDRR